MIVYIYETYWSHRLGPFSVATLQQFDLLYIIADLYQVTNSERLIVRTRAGDRHGYLHLGKHGRIESPSIAAGIGHNDIVIFVDSNDRSRGAKAFKHAVRPATMAVLQRLYNLQFQIDVDLRTDQTTR